MEHGKRNVPLARVARGVASETSPWHAEDIRRLAEPIRLGAVRATLFKVLQKTGLINFYWDKQLKENNAYEKRFDRPYRS